MRLLPVLGLLIMGTYSVYGDIEQLVDYEQEETESESPSFCLISSDIPSKPSVFSGVGFRTQIATPQSQPLEEPIEHHSRFQIGANYTHASIKIHDQPLFHGNLGGAQGSYEYRPWDYLYAGVNLTWKQGETEGSNQKRDLVSIDAQERIGYTVAFHRNLCFFTLFAGVGYRYLSHRLKQHGESAIRFYYNEIYIPVGFLSDYFVKPWWSIGLNFTWMPQVYPTVKIAPLKGARWILEKTLGNFRVEVPWTFYFTKAQKYSLIFKPFYEYWEDGHSTAKMSNGAPLGLPGNDYNFWGAELNFAYSF